MKILFSYSHAHYDPRIPEENHQYWQSSASILARSFYQELLQHGEVTYIDRDDFQSVEGMEFDLFVGIIENYGKILDRIKVKKTLLLTVNMHPKERNRILRSASREFGLPVDGLARWDLVNEREMELAIEKAQGILCVGNDVTVRSFLDNGVARSKIRRLNYGLDARAATKLELKPVQGSRRFIYSASEIGLRKGFDLLADLLRQMEEQQLDYHLDIIGTASSPHYQARLEKLLKLNSSKITFHGWLDSAKQSYKDVLASAQFLIFPTLEEGQAGTVLDGMSHGLIPLISARAGVDFAPLGYLDLKLSSDNNIGILKSAVSMSDRYLEELRQITLDYYEEFHAGFKKNVSAIIKGFVSGHLFPKLSVTMPIFNKEFSIKELISYLDLACLAYPNTELHIVFDGCKDRSEPIVRSYLKNRSYTITYETTPNIFEVKTNNIGMRKSTGEICAIVQDDNYIYDPHCWYHAADFFSLSSKAAVLGGLAGVNFFDRGTRGLPGPGQIAYSENEVYWRQDAVTNPAFAKRIYQVDACMRGPLFITKAFLEQHGYLDEIYAPLYQDDMDLCIRARDLGYKVFCRIMNVENRSLTMAHYDAERNKFFTDVMKKNTDIFYSRYRFTDPKPTFWIHQNNVDGGPGTFQSLRASYYQRLQRAIIFKGRVIRKLRKIASRYGLQLSLNKTSN